MEEHVTVLSDGESIQTFIPQNSTEIETTEQLIHFII